MTAIDISIPVGFGDPQSPEKDFMATYCGLFDLFRGAFCGVHSLRLELRMPPFDPLVDFFNEQRMKAIIEPIDRLSESRSWTQLQLCAPHDWYLHFKKFKERMVGQAEWELTETVWSDQWMAVCVGMN